MMSLAVGMAIFYIIQCLRPTKFEAKGIIGIALWLFTCWGLGSLTLALVGASH